MTDTVQFDRRSAQRSRVIKGGLIAFHNLSSSFSCMVRSLSETGACLGVQHSFGIPNRFELVVHGDKLRRQCRVAWRSNNRLGVRFV